MGWSKCRIRCLLSSLIAVTPRRQAESWGQVLAHKMSRAVPAGGASIAGSRPSERRCHPLWAMTPWPGEARVKRSDFDAWALGTADAGKTMSEADVELGPVDYVGASPPGQAALGRGCPPSRPGCALTEDPRLWAAALTLAAGVGPAVGSTGWQRQPQRCRWPGPGAEGAVGHRPRDAGAGYRQEVRS
jgi:hypothetical protein